MMPPVLIMPPPDESGDTEDGYIIEDEDLIAPLSILEVPIPDIPDDDEQKQRSPMLVRLFFAA